MKKYYWTMKNGEKINVDDMDITHLRNVLKMILRNSILLYGIKAQSNRRPFEVNGELAQEDAFKYEMHLMGVDFDEDSLQEQHLI